jgi:DNA-binding transcriptional ArsR family regulator
MVESRGEHLDETLRALANPARRAMLERLTQGELTVGELAAPMRMTTAGVSKHLDVLERAQLVERRREGRESHCRIRPKGLDAVFSLVDRYRLMWGTQLDTLGRYLRETPGRR